MQPFYFLNWRERSAYFFHCWKSDVFFITGSGWRLTHPAVCPELGQTLIPPLPHTACGEECGVTLVCDWEETWHQGAGMCSLPPSSLQHRQQVDKSFTHPAHVPESSLLVCLSSAAIKGKRHLCGSRRSFPVSRKLPLGCWTFGKSVKESRWAPFTKCFQPAQTSSFTSFSIVCVLMRTK